MSRFIGERDSGPILEAASFWKNECLMTKGSVFSEESIWTLENIEALEKYFSDNPLDGEGDFFSKLEMQIEPTLPPVKKLAAEMLWLMFLCSSNVTAKKKRENVLRVWSWSGEELSAEHSMLGDDVLLGVGSSGTSYNTNRWRELVYFIRICKIFISLPEAQKEQLLGNGWDFAEWLTNIEGTESRQLRHMLLYLLFPDDFERIFGGTDRKSIVKAFTNFAATKINQMSLLEMDHLLAEIRQDQGVQFGTTEIDFYEAPLVQLWRKTEPSHYLFCWNPSRWEWDNLAEAIAATTTGKLVRRRWSCKNRQVGVGDKAWLLRVGVPPKGIMAVGNVVEEPYEEPHWDAEKASAGKTCWYVDIEFSQIRDPFGDQVISPDVLSTITVDGQDWNPQSSGSEIKRRSAGVLEKAWQQFSIKPDSVTSALAVVLPKNIIYYGPPGTGKTYQLNQLKEDYCIKKAVLSRDQWLSEELQTTRWFDVVFMALYALGGKAKVPQIAGHEFIVQKARALGRTSNIKQQIWATLQTHTLEQSLTVKYDKRQVPEVFDKTKDSLWFLAGGWQEECEDLVVQAERLKAGPVSGQEIRRYEFVTFHQAYGYEDFVEGIRPIPADDSAELTYQVVPGIFRRICTRAMNDPESRYAIFIDEINRGNIAKIFGELITLIELDKRVSSMSKPFNGGTWVTLPYSGDLFGVPDNLDIYGAMNTADRSIALLDTALRRRFLFKELMPKPNVISGAQGDGYIPDGEGGLINLREMLDVMNQRIRFLLNRDMMLGHAYLNKVKTFTELKGVVFNQFIPLLQEYFYDDWYRIQLVFGDVGINNESVEPQIIVHNNVKSADAFGFDLDDFDEVMEYRVADYDQVTPDSIRKIYETGN